MIMDDSQLDQDEEELQGLLKQTPEPSTVQCMFCDNRAYRYVEPDEVGLDEPSEVEGLVAVCHECYPDDGDECLDCLFGRFCPLHMTEDEWVLARLARFFGLGDDEDEDYVEDE